MILACLPSPKNKASGREDQSDKDIVLHAAREPLRSKRIQRKTQR